MTLDTGNTDCANGIHTTEGDSNICLYCGERIMQTPTAPKDSPIPPEGCTCGALWTVRGVHGKLDCPFMDSGDGVEAVDKVLRTLIEETEDLWDQFMEGDDPDPQKYDDFYDNALNHAEAAIELLLQEREIKGRIDEVNLFNTDEALEMPDEYIVNRRNHLLELQSNLPRKGDV